MRHTSTARSYHLYIALLYGFGIAAVYVFVRVGSGSRWVALWTAAASAMISPSFLLFKDIPHRQPGHHYMPIRLGVLVRYGEGPHMSAWALSAVLPGGGVEGAAARTYGLLALAGVIAALVVANNFYGATALAIFFPMVVWVGLAGGAGPMVWARALGITALAGGLCAFWLTPSFLRITLDNMKLVSLPGHVWSEVLGAFVLAAFAAISWRFGRGRPERAWTVFSLGALASWGLMSSAISGTTSA